MRLHGLGDPKYQRGDSKNRDIWWDGPAHCAHVLGCCDGVLPGREQDTCLPLRSSHMGCDREVRSVAIDGGATEEKLPVPFLASY